MPVFAETNGKNLDLCIFDAKKNLDLCCFSLYKNLDLCYNMCIENLGLCIFYMYKNLDLCKGVIKNLDFIIFWRCI